jgi:hypothetical protein
MTLIGLPTSVSAQAPLLQLEHLNRLASQAREVVDVTVDSTMLQTASALLSSDKGKDDAATKALIAGLKGVYVKSYEFDREGVYTDADVETVRAQLKTPWSRIVNINSRQDRERTEIYLWRDSDQPGGLAIVIAEPKELTIVNIIGRIDLAQLAGLKGVLGIPQILGAVPGVGTQKR